MKSSTGSFHILRLLLICSFTFSSIRTTHADTDVNNVVYTLNADDSARLLYKLNFLQTYDGLDSLKGILLLSTLNHLYAAEPDLNPEVASLTMQYIDKMYDDYFTGPITQSTSLLTSQSVLTPEDIQSGNISRLRRFGQEVYKNVKDFWITKGNGKDVLVGITQDLGVDMSQKIVDESAKVGLTAAAKQAWAKANVATMILFSFNKQIYTKLYQESKVIDWKTFPSDAYNFFKNGGVPDNVDRAIQMSGAQTVQVSRDRMRALSDGAVDTAYKKARANSKMAQAMRSPVIKDKLGVDVTDTAKDIITKKPALLPDQIKQTGFIDQNGNITASANELLAASNAQLKDLTDDLQQQRDELKVIVQQQANLSLTVEQIRARLSVEAVARAEEKKKQEKQDLNDKLLKSAEGTVYFLSQAAKLLPIPNAESIANGIDVVGNAAIKTVETVQQFQKAVDVLGALGAVGTGFAVGGLLGGLVGVASSLISLFGSSGPTPERQILDEVHKLREELQAFRTEMHERLDIIDAKLDAGFATLGRQLERLEQLTNDTRVDALSGLAQLQSDVYQVQTRLGDYFCQSLLNELNTTIFQAVWIPRITGRTLTETEYRTHRDALLSIVRVKATSGICDKQPNGGPLPSELADENIGKRLRDDIGSYVGALNTLNAWLKLKTNGQQRLSDQATIPYYGIWVLAAEAYRDLALDNLKYSVNDGPIRDEFRVGGEQIRNALERISNVGTVDQPKANLDLVNLILNNYKDKFDDLIKAFNNLQNKKQLQWQEQFMAPNSRQTAKPPYAPNGWFQPTDWTLYRQNDLYDRFYDPTEIRDPNLDPKLPAGTMGSCKGNYVVRLHIPGNVRYYMFGGGKWNIPPVIAMADYMGMSPVQVCYDFNFLTPSPVHICAATESTQARLTIFALSGSRTFYRQDFNLVKFINFACPSPDPRLTEEEFLKANDIDITHSIEQGCWLGTTPPEVSQVPGEECKSHIESIANQVSPDSAAFSARSTVIAKVASMQKEFYAAARDEMKQEVDSQSNPRSNLSLALARYDGARELLNAFIQVGFPRAFERDESLRALLVSPFKSQALPSAKDIQDQVALFADSIDPAYGLNGLFDEPYVHLRRIYCGEELDCPDGSLAPLTITGTRQLIASEAPPSLSASLHDQISRTVTSRLYQLKDNIYHYLDAINADANQVASNTHLSDASTPTTAYTPSTPTDAQFQIVAFHSGKCLDNLIQDLQIVQSTCGREDPEDLWQLESVGSSYLVRNNARGKCMTVEDIQNAAGQNATLHLAACNRLAGEQLFQLVYGKSGPGLKIVATTNGKCISITDPTSALTQIDNGTPAVLDTCAYGSNNQIFNFMPSGAPVDPGLSKTYIKPYQELHLGIETALSSLEALSMNIDTVQRGLPPLPFQQEGVFLPIVTQSIAQMEQLPDLVTGVSLNPNKSNFTSGEEVTITVTITNQGVKASGPFWVDLYINPTQMPSTANLRWNETCTFDTNRCWGIAWYVATSLAPGQSITLVSTPRSYDPGQTRWPGWFTSGTTDLYVYADSFNPGVSTGLVAESNEGNNRAEIHGLSVTGPNMVVQAPTALQNPVEQRMVMK